PAAREEVVEGDRASPLHQVSEVVGATRGRPRPRPPYTPKYRMSGWWETSAETLPSGSIISPSRPVHCSGWLCRSPAVYSTGTKSGLPKYVLSNTQPPDEPCGPCGVPALASRK